MPTAPALRPALLPAGARGLWQRGLITQVGCLLIAVALALVTGHFLVNWLYSVLIGTLCWLFIDGARGAVVWLRSPRTAPASLDGWPGWGWMLPIALAGGTAGFHLGSALGRWLTGHPLVAAGPDAAASGGTSIGVLVMSLAATLVITGFYEARGRIAASEAAAAEMRRQATEAQLTLLQSQLEPHMLFNTLANLRVLIGLDAPRAQQMLDHLVAYLRSTLAASRAAQHPLADEFDRLADYLALMAVRMGPRLVTRLDLPDDLRQVPVPPLLLQPLVENAIGHGLEPQVAGGRVEISARQVDGRLELTVRDTGVGVPGLATASIMAPGRGAPEDSASKRQVGGFGLQQVRERLATRYGAAASLTLLPANDADGGTRARIVLPLPPAAPTA